MPLPPRSANAPTIPWVLFGLRGRIGRQTYWLSYLFLISLNSVVVAQIIGGAEASFYGPASALAPALALLTLYANIAATVKRLHDFDTNGLLAIAIVVPLINIGVTIWAGIVPSTPGANRFGPGPDRPSV